MEISSTDFNLTNPMSTNTITLDRTWPSCQFPEVVYCTEEEYKMMHKDPTAVYIVTDNNSAHMGESPVNCYEKGSRYLISSTGEDEYTLFLYVDHPVTHPGLIKIATFDDPHVAMNYQRLYNLTGSHAETAMNIYKSLEAYINRASWISSTILGIIASFGYRDNTMFHDMVRILSEIGADRDTRKLSRFVVDYIPRYKNSSNHMFIYYSNLYDLFVMYDFFKDPKWNVEKPDLSEVIRKVFYIMMHQPQNEVIDSRPL